MMIVIAKDKEGKMVSEKPLLILLLILFANAFTLAQQSEFNLDALSLESLLNTEISTAAKYSQKASEAPASVTIITAEEIKTQGYKTLNEVLATVRSFYIAYDRNYGYIGARGFGKSNTYNLHVLLLLNGHSINENVFGSAPSGSEFVLDFNSIERIEIVRGPGSALYGTGAVLAVINIITKHGDTIDGLSLSGTTGSFGKKSGSLLYGKKLNSGVSLTTSASINNFKGQNLYFKEYDDSLTNNGWANNLDSEKGYGLFSGAEKGNFKAQIFASWREKEIPTAAWGMYFNTGPSKSVDSWNFAEIQYQKQVVTDKNVWGRVYYNHYYYHGWYPYDVMNYDEVFSDWIGGELQFRWDFGERSRLTLGGEAQNNMRSTYKAWQTDFVFFDKNISSTVFSYYVQDEYQWFSSLSTTAGVRIDRYSDTKTATTPRFALVYNIFKPTTLKLLYGEAFRRANIYETYYEDEYSGNKPNLNIKPEKTKTMECDIEQKIGRHFYGAFSIYSYKMRDLIDQILDPEDSLLQYANFNKAKASGGELELKFRSSEMGVYAYASYSYSQAEDEESGLDLINYPANIVNIGGSFPLIKMARISTDIIWEDSRLTVYDSNTDPFWLMNVSIIARPFYHFAMDKNTILNKLEVAFQIRNLFDTQYSHPATLEFEQEAIEQDGRNMQFRVTLDL